MNKAEKDTIKAHLNAEQKALQDLEKAYKQAKKDCQERIKALNARTDMQNLQTIVHQRKYQQVLLKQIDSVLNDLQTHTYKSANEFFQSAYENGYIGSMYEFIYQDIPLTIPISRKKMMTAIQTDSKISKDYYLKQGLTVQNIRTLKQQIAQEATRGIASGKSWLEVANSLSIQRYFSISLSDAMRICRTEGNRINQQARLDAGDEAVKAGCDLLKQWDATMDDKTRPWHREADGQIVEWNESFTVMGEKLKAPSIGGSAKNVINCRCQLLKRPRWALDEEELERLKKRAEYFGLDKSQSFEEYKQKFLKASELTDDQKLWNLNKQNHDIGESITNKERELRSLEDIQKAGAKKGFSRFDGKTENDLIQEKEALERKEMELSRQIDDWKRTHKRPSMEDFDTETDEGWEAYSKARDLWRKERREFESKINEEIYKIMDQVKDLNEGIYHWSDVELYRKSLTYSNGELTKKIDDLYAEIKNLKDQRTNLDSEISKLKQLMSERDKQKTVDNLIASSKTGFKTQNGEYKQYQREAKLGDGTSSGFKRVAKVNVYVTPEGKEFEFPVGLNKKKQSLTPEQLAKAWERVPEAIRKKAPKTIQVLDYYNPRDTYWKQKYKSFSHSYATGGSGGLTFYRYDYDHDDDYLVDTLCHEIGHVIDESIKTPSGIRFCDDVQWTKAIADDLVHSGMKSPTAYGENANVEDLAESVAQYTINHDWFVKKFPNRTKVLEKYILN